jgi:hypothetical protein
VHDLVGIRPGDGVAGGDRQRCGAEGEVGDLDGMVGAAGPRR